MQEEPEKDLLPSSKEEEEEELRVQGPGVNEVSFQGPTTICITHWE
jgi:hypothetical protein